ncbi:MAG: GAF domain-containing protein [Candidatus Omnitrophota bacterium]
MDSEYRRLADYLVDGIHKLTGEDVILWMMSDKEGKKGKYMEIASYKGDFKKESNDKIELPVDTGKSIFELAFEKKAPIKRCDIQNNPEESNFFGIEYSKKHNWHSVMVYPLILGDDTRIGAFTFHSPEVGKFDNFDTKILKSFILIAAIAIQKLRESRKLQKLAEVGEVLTQQMPLGKTKLLIRASYEARNLFQADYAAIFIYHPLTKQCERIGISNSRVQDECYDDRCDNCFFSSEKCPLSSNRNKKEDWIKCSATLVRETGEIIAHDIDRKIFDFFQDGEKTVRIGAGKILRIIQKTKFFKQENIKAFAGIPLRVVKDEKTKKIKSEEVGVLFIFFKKPHDFSADEMQLIRIYAHQLANIILSAYLYETSQRQTKELEALHETSLKIVAQEDCDKLLEVIVEESVKLLNAKGGMVFLIINEQQKIKLVAQKGVPPKDFPVGDLINFGEGMTGRVVQTGKYLIVNDYSKWKKRIPRLEHIFTAVIEVPLLLMGKCIGVIAVFDDVERRIFSQRDDLPVMQRLAQQAALAIHLRRQAETLREASNAMGSILELNETAGNILDNLGKVVEYKKASIQLFRGNDREIIAHRGYNKESIEKESFRPVSQDPFLENIIKQKEALITSNYSQNRESDDKLKARAGFPLIFENKVIGVLTLEHDNLEYYKDKINALMPFTRDASNAIGKARVLDDAKRRIRDLEIIQDIVEKINTGLDTKKQLKTLVKEIAKTLGCSHCTLLLPEKKNNEIVLVPRQTHGWPKGHKMNRKFKPGEGIAGWVFQKGQSIMLPDAAQDFRFIQGKRNTASKRSMLVVPLKVGSRTIGVISADKGETNWFNENDKKKIEEFAKRSSIFIEQSIGQELLPQISMQIISSTEEDVILQRFITGAVKLINATSGIIYMIGSDGRSIEKSYPYPIEFAPLMLPRMDKEEGITRQVIKSAKIIPISDIRLDDRINPLFHESFQSVIAVPLKIEGKVIGVLYLYDRIPRYFSETECFLLETLSSQAAISIKNAQLFDQVKHHHDNQIKAVQQISRSISEPTHLNEVLKGILQWVVTLMVNVNFCDIYLFNKEKNELVVEALQGILISEKHTKLRIGEGIVGWSAEHKKTYVAQDVRKDERYLKAIEETNSQIAVPLMKRNELIGVLNIERAEINSFKPEDINLAEAIAGLAAIAIENSSLYLNLERKVEERTAELERTKEKAAAAERLALVNEIVAEFAHKMNNLAGTIPTRVSMALEHLNKEDPLQKKSIHQLEAIKYDTQKLLKLANEIKHTTTMGKLEHIDINFLLEESINNVLNSSPGVVTRIKLIRDYAENLPGIYAERTCFLDTMENLIRNGIESIIENGVIEIHTNLISNSNKRFISIKVSDTGKGIPEKIRYKIFDLFFTTKEKGLGFGLWRDRAFIKRLGGDIVFESKEEEGTTFNINIPIE